MGSDNTKKWTLVLAGCLVFLLLRVVWLAHKKGRFEGPVLLGKSTTCENNRRRLIWFTEKHFETAPGKPVSQQDLLDLGVPVASFTCEFGGTLICKDSSEFYMWKCSKCTPMQLETKRQLAEADELNKKPLRVILNGLSKLSILEVLWLDRLRLLR